MTEPATLAGTDRPLIAVHDAFLLDLDGVVQLDDEPVEAAPGVLAQLRSRDVAVVFLTNNAARPPAEVVARLGKLGVEADETQVVTSAMAAAALLGGRLPSGAAVLVVGGAGLVEALTAAGLRPVRDANDDVAAVVQGWAPEVGWQQLAEAAVALRGGAPWVATNDDLTLPSPRGPLPGNGSLVAALATATGLRPEVVGKPHRPLFDAACARAGGGAPLVVGDRLDTDIAGARAAGLPSLVVLTGVARPRDLLAAAPASRPTYLGADLRALLTPHPAVEVAADRAVCAATTVTSGGEVTGDGRGSLPDGVDGLRAACALAWTGVLPREKYDEVVDRLGLD